MGLYGSQIQFGRFGEEIMLKKEAVTYLNKNSRTSSEALRKATNTPPSLRIKGGLAKIRNGRPSLHFTNTSHKPHRLSQFALCLGSTKKCSKQLNSKHFNSTQQTLRVE
jgi:hypothetical protein